MAVNVFIDGKEGTTGLKIFERFADRSDINIMQIDEDKRKDPAEKAKIINASDYTFLCLPDAAAVESVQLCTNPKTRIIDASTAHRTNPEWAYGFPELDASFREKIAGSNRVAVPGCYASGFVSLGYPLVKSGIMPADYPVVIHAVSGYSGAGKKAIAQYEADGRNPELDSPRLYALTQTHKHLPEMKKIAGLEYEPVFNPYVCDYFQGMTVTVGLHARLLAKKVTASDVWEMFAAHYDGCRFVKVAGFMGEGVLEEPFIPANTLAGTNMMQIFVYGNDDRIMLTSRFDNLGKGASGAAVQCLNIMLGIDEAAGLV
ncbi:MAG: N-acetyl-gamma-glutamyl-phosphate reductase [Treponema porcinum]|uniref:N-acetyl-gamma-glutamyl-phosphate reductase n=1 Tax=Treponema porcinum TaxID=261392 RepID=UPI002352D1F4|nr:N-acetyl-gamma-glutamyl-phosphate reductase [Treponema porcinum]MCI6179459.1 N-acetyl-gamma-glutamyl-phosphate reductase [Treponema porcinum]MCI7114940.1 N-acetyl-gamma-glutamyl-phosphate reductase [Treponema porcinum]MCI7545565.1 N-acetyl-gamma-glutamyl-phosphate reductase [Treponema porcinum]MDD6898503.1 N-acetyl-gamma-glutamyl-phosphate reductase [Treponema porcinum]MDY4189019.1 N-acetyl-gamma-glutamyl-phosphate reductase [Treponema porcinum]